MFHVTLLLLSGCGLLGGGSEPASDGPSEPLAPTVQKAKEATGISALIQEGIRQGMPAPPPKAIGRSQCGDMTDGGPVDEYGVTGEIECGETVIGHTKGGIDRFDTRWYERNFCTPATTDHDGGDERVYRLRLPDGKQRAFITLDTPCADLEVTAIQWSDKELPGPKTNVNDCDTQIKPGNTREVVEAVSDGNWRDWLILVEGKDDEEGAFAVTVQCVNHL